MRAIILTTLVVKCVAAYEHRSLMRNEHVPGLMTVTNEVDTLRLENEALRARLKQLEENERLRLSSGAALAELGRVNENATTVPVASAEFTPASRINVEVSKGSEEHVSLLENVTASEAMGQNIYISVARIYVTVSCSASMVIFMAYVIFYVGNGNNDGKRDSANHSHWVRLFCAAQILFGLGMVPLAWTVSPVGVPDWALKPITWPIRGVQLAQGIYDVVGPWYVYFNLGRDAAAGLWDNEDMLNFEEQSGFPATKSFMALSLAIAGPRVASPLLALLGTPSVWMDLVCVLNYSSMMMNLIDLYSMENRVLFQWFARASFYLDATFMTFIPVNLLLGWYTHF